MCPLQGDRQTDWEEETLALIEEMKQDREKADQRRRNAERQVQKLDTDIAAGHQMVDRYRAKYGLGKSGLPIVSPEQAKEYHGLGTKQMIIRWAGEHNGEIVMREMCQFLAATRLFKDAQQAAGSLYSAINRMPEFEKLGRGVYRQKMAPQGEKGEPATQSNGQPADSEASQWIGADGKAMDEEAPMIPDDIPF